MQVVIEIPEEQYNDIIEHYNTFPNEWKKWGLQAIKNGVPLPKGHGDLITKEQAIELVEFYQINPQHFNFINLIDEIKDEKPIVEADRNEVMQEYESY